MTKSPQRIRSLRLNQGDTIRPTSAENFEWEHICAVIESNEAFQAMVSKCLENKYSDTEDIDLLVEEKIFAGFYSYQDKELLQKFQTSNWTGRLALLGEVQDERIQQLGRRLVAFNARHLLDDKYQNVVQEYLADKWSAGEADVRWATIASVHAQLSELEKEGFDESLLEEMRTFYRNRIKAQGCSVDF
jgi:exodeoxyribonuclease-1